MIRSFPLWRREIRFVVFQEGGLSEVWSRDAKLINSDAVHTLREGRGVEADGRPEYIDKKQYPRRR